MDDDLRNEKMKVEFDRELIIEEIEGYYFFYSPLLGEWLKGDETAKFLVENIIRSGGIIDLEELKTTLISKGILDVAHVDLWIKKLLQTPLFFTSEEEFKAASQKFKKAYEIPQDQPLETVYLHPTHRCNFNCVYCFNGMISKEKAKELSTHKWTEIIASLKDVGVKTFIFTGGEPLLREDLHCIISRVKEEKKGEYNVTVLTNGSLLTEARIEELLPLVDMFIISIDSMDIGVHKMTRSTFGFDVIKKAITLLGERAPEKIRTRSVLTRRNVHDILKTVKTLKREYSTSDHEIALRLPNTVEEIGLIPDITDIERIEEEVLVLEPRELVVHGKVRCGAATKIIAVDMQGDIYPCQSLIEEREFKLGTMLNKNWYSTIQSSPIRELFRTLSVDTREGHKTCYFRYLCGGGCPAVAWKLYGRLDAFLPFFCEHNKLSAKKRMVLHRVEEM